MAKKDSTPTTEIGFSGINYIDNVRRELDAKIEKLNAKVEKKIPIWLFCWVIGGIFLILAWFGIYFVTNHLEKHFKIESHLSYLESLQKKK
jgi:hypothetical protein